MNVDPAASVEVVQANIAALLSLTFSHDFFNLTANSISILPVGTYTLYSTLGYLHQSKINQTDFLTSITVSKKDVCLCHMQLTFFYLERIYVHNYMIFVQLLYFIDLKQTLGLTGNVHLRHEH